MSAIAKNQVFSAVHTVGGLLPADMLVRISEGKDVAGSKPADYGVAGARSVRDDAERRWDFLKSVWQDLRAEDKLPAAPAAEPPADPTGLAVSQWVQPLLDELGFGRVSTVGAAITSDDGTKEFAVSHRWRHVPVHIAAWNHALDRRPGGAGTVPPQSLVQEALNRTSAHLWAVVTNGRQLRLLRDSSALATASYVEFDLEAIFDGELFSEFVLLYRLLHASRFEVGEGEAPSACWLEKWRTDAITSGVLALDALRGNVEDAIRTLGTGFLKHPANGRLRSGLDVDALHKALLRLVYRMLFLFVIEERDVLHPDKADGQARRRYADYFSTARLRRHARRRRGTAHGDQYRALRIVLEALGDEHGRPELGLPGLGGLFDDKEADAPLHGLELSNESLLGAVRHLAQVRDPDSGRWRAVDYRNMGAEELGSVYESLLETVPKHSATDGGTFDLVARLGNERKKTGSYYTPSSLIECLLDSTLDPVLDDAVKRGEVQATAAGEPDASGHITDELLALTVCDPACGSGHFLVAAARRIAKRVAAVRERNPEPTTDAVRHAMHEVVARCIYGVDLNPMAVELAKVSLWLEAMESGQPLNFLDAHVKHGNALIGATPTLLRGDIPDGAYKAVEGDDETYADSFAAINAQQREGQATLFEVDKDTVKVANTVFAAQLRRIMGAASGTLSDVRRQEEAYRAWERDGAYARAVHVADAWCAAFMWRKTADAPPPVTHDVFRGLADPKGAAASAETNEEIVRLRDQYGFFHWHLEFPDVFTVPESRTGVGEGPGWTGGFDCVLGNPPWDKVDFEDKKYFSVVDPSIAAIPGVARGQRIAEWMREFPELGNKYLADRRKVKSTFLFASRSGAFPLCAKGLTVKGVNSLQTDQLFAERFESVTGDRGRFGCIIPTAIATGAGAQHIFQEFTQRGAVKSLYDFENLKKLFEGVDARQKFCLLSLAGKELREPVAAFAFFLYGTDDLDNAGRIFALSPDEIKLLNPNTGTLPIFRSRSDADLTVSVYHRIPVLWNESDRNGNPWGIRFKRLFDMKDDSGLFRSREKLEDEGWDLSGNIFTRGGKRMLPLYEAKMVDFFNHRAADVVKSATAVNRQNQPRYLAASELKDSNRFAMPLNWIAEADVPTGKLDKRGRPTYILGVSSRLAEVKWEREWLYGWCDVTASTNERTSIPAFVPSAAVGHKFPLMMVSQEPSLVAALCAAQSSLVFDYISRQKIGSTSMGLFIWKQLPVPSPKYLGAHTPFLVPRVLELVYTARDMSPLARDLADDGAPFHWSEERRAVIRAELDAYFFYLYGIDRANVDYIMDTFQTASGGLKNNDIAKYGTYRTKDLVLEVYDRMADTGVSLETPLSDGESFTSALTPPPGHGPRHYSAI